MLLNYSYVAVIVPRGQGQLSSRAAASKPGVFRCRCWKRLVVLQTGSQVEDE